MRANCLWMSAIFAQSRLSIILQIRRHVQIRDVICFYFIWRVHLDKVRFFACAHARISASMFTDYLLVCNVNAASRLNSQWPSNFLSFAKAVISTVGGGQVSLTFSKSKFCLLHVYCFRSIFSLKSLQTITWEELIKILICLSESHSVIAIHSKQRTGCPKLFEKVVEAVCRLKEIPADFTLGLKRYWQVCFSIFLLIFSQKDTGLFAVKTQIKHHQSIYPSVYTIPRRACKLEGKSMA